MEDIIDAIQPTTIGKGMRVKKPTQKVLKSAEVKTINNDDKAVRSLNIFQFCCALFFVDHCHPYGFFSLQKTRPQRRRDKEGTSERATGEILHLLRAQKDNGGNDDQHSRVRQFFISKFLYTIILRAQFLRTDQPDITICTRTK